MQFANCVHSGLEGEEKRESPGLPAALLNLRTAKQCLYWSYHDAICRQKNKREKSEHGQTTEDSAAERSCSGRVPGTNPKANRPLEKWPISAFDWKIRHRTLLFVASVCMLNFSTCSPENGIPWIDGDYVNLARACTDGACPTDMSSVYRNEESYWCPGGYARADGSVPGAGIIDGRGGGEVVPHCGTCAQLCSDYSTCVSFECSLTEVLADCGTSSVYLASIS